MPFEYYSPTCGGAISTIIMEVARELEKLGHQITVLTKVNQEPLHKVGTVIPIDAPVKQDLSLASRVKWKLLYKLGGWDWPYFGPYKDSFSAKLRALPSPPDAVVVFNDFASPKYINEVLPQSRICVWLQNEQSTQQADPARYASRVFTCSEYIRQASIKGLNIAPSKISTVMSGVDLETFKPSASWPRKAGDDELKTLFVGRIDPNKGPDIGLDAVERLVKEGVKISYTIVGDVWFYPAPHDPRQKFKQDLMKRVEGSSFVHYLGHVDRDRLPQLYQEHDVVFVLSRSEEPLGLVVLEAMASGCAVIVSNRGGLPEASGGAAIEIGQPDDLDSICAQLRRLASDDQFLQECKVRSRKRAETASWGECARGVLNSL